MCHYCEAVAAAAADDGGDGDDCDDYVSNRAEVMGERQRYKWSYDNLHDSRDANHRPLDSHSTQTPAHLLLYTNNIL